MTHLRLLPFILLLAIPGLARSQDAPVPGDGPRDVRLGLYVMDITEISDLDNTFRAELDFENQWHDPARAWTPINGETDPRTFLNERALEEVAKGWGPNLGVVNTSGDLPWTHLQLKIYSDGRAVLRGRINGLFRSYLDFHRFPFDSQALVLNVESNIWDTRELDLAPNPDRTGISSEVYLAEWNVTGIETSVSVYENGRRGVIRDRLRVEIGIERKSRFYVLKIIAPLVAIVFITSVVFWMRGEDLGRRAGISSTGMLTVIAYQFIVSAFLPRVAYLTVMDKIVLLTFLFISVTMLMNILASSGPFLASGRGERLDRVARLVYPVSYVAGLALLAIRAL